MQKFKLKDIFTISNFISFLRILLFFPIYYTISNLQVNDSFRYYTLGLFFIVYLTDISDGYLARKLNQVTEIGKVIDPFADKILVALIVVQLFIQNDIPAFYFYIIIGRDLLIFIGGIFVSRKIGFVLPSNYTGKGTVFSIGLFFILVVLNVKTTIPVLYYFVEYLSILLCFISVFVYARRGYIEIKEHK
jgi:CDP-diacylglycerol--glycerol-3-phosphate 3-phosphatidyltransferase